MIVADPESNIRNGDVGHGNNLSPCTQQTCQKGVLSSFADFLQYVSTSKTWRSTLTQTQRLQSKCGSPCYFDELLRTETLGDDWVRLLGKYPGLPRVELPVVNDDGEADDSKHPWGAPPEAYYTTRLRKIVQDVDDFVFTRFDYPQWPQANATDADDATLGSATLGSATPTGEADGTWDDVNPSSPWNTTDARRR